jgi:hypothetical protein
VVHQLSNGRSLQAVGMALFQRYGLINSLAISEHKLLAFLQVAPARKSVLGSYCMACAAVKHTRRGPVCLGFFFG